MTYLLFALVIMLLCGIFIPYGIGEGIENVPLLIFILAVVLVVLIVKLIKYISVLVKAKNHLNNTKKLNKLKAFKINPFLQFCIKTSCKTCV